MSRASAWQTPLVSDAELLRAQIEASGLSAVRFARDVLGRDPRTVRRWLAGETVPDSIRDWLARLSEVRVTTSRVHIEVERG